MLKAKLSKKFLSLKMCQIFTVFGLGGHRFEKDVIFTEKGMS